MKSGRAYSTAVVRLSKFRDTQWWGLLLYCPGGAKVVGRGEVPRLAAASDLPLGQAVDQAIQLFERVILDFDFSASVCARPEMHLGSERVAQAVFDRSLIRVGGAVEVLNKLLRVAHVEAPAHDRILSRIYGRLKLSSVLLRQA